MQRYVRPALTPDQGRALWRAIAEEVEAQRLAAGSLAAVTVKLAVLVPLFAAALFFAWIEGSGLAYAALALLLAQFAFIGHDAGHGAISGGGPLDRGLGQLVMTVLTGLAFDEWIARHRAHHRYCQDETRDPDMAVDFVASLTHASRRRKGALGRLMTRYQAVHIWVLSLAFGHSQRHLSQAAVLADPRRHALDLCYLVAHAALWFGLPFALGVPAERIALAYLIPLTLLGPYLAAIFWVNHVGMPLVKDPERFSFFEHQIVTSRTIVNPPAWDWVFGGLNFQIEHHLFPQVPSLRLPAVQAIVRPHLARARIPYNAVSWPEAVASLARHLRRVARAA